ncbi:MAG: YggT family protein [Actinomycetia bacterium]|nr:YggT family protein [Actinomycetes bacterium]MCP4227319.1 YggT family protein [Actinomycetes bacterium]MCP5034353.1 YggT family protein [Actinomycetes bacterium]
MTYVCIFLLAFQFVFLLRLVMSFFPLGSGSTASSVRDLAVVVTDPVILPLRRSLPPLPGALAGFGLAEILVLIGLQVLETILCR